MEQVIKLTELIDCLNHLRKKYENEKNESQGFLSNYMDSKISVLHDIKEYLKL